MGHIKSGITFIKFWLLLIWDTRPEFFRKSYWIADFPDYYHHKCFDCDLTSCPIECKYYL
jgi:hypothetical protein